MGRHCYPRGSARAFLYKVLEIMIPVMFTPVYSPLTNGRLAKSLNMSSQGGYCVSSNPVLAGRLVHELLGMLKRITQTLRTERVFDGRVTYGERKDIPSGSSGVSIELYSSELSESSSVGKAQKSSKERSKHGETSSVSNCSTQSRLHRGK